MTRSAASRDFVICSCNVGSKQETMFMRFLENDCSRQDRTLFLRFATGIFFISLNSLSTQWHVSVHICQLQTFLSPKIFTNDIPYYSRPNRTLQRGRRRSKPPQRSILAAPTRLMPHRLAPGAGGARLEHRAIARAAHVYPANGHGPVREPGAVELEDEAGKGFRVLVLR